jgi:hypothetical protein
MKSKIIKVSLALFIFISPIMAMSQNYYTSDSIPIVTDFPAKINKITIKKGKHKVKSPLKIYTNNVYTKNIIIFTDSTAYTFEGKKEKDQEDWNVGGGLSENLFNQYRSSIFWLWRYNPTTNKFEIGARFYKDDKKRTIKKMGVDKTSKHLQILFTINPYEHFFVILERNRKLKYMRITFQNMNGDNLFTTVQNCKCSTFVKRAKGRFGEDERTPHKLIFYISDPIKY